MTAATYDLSDMMIEAHAAAKRCFENPAFYVGWSYAKIFAGQLRRVWSDAKCRVAAAERQSAYVAMSDVERLREALYLLDCKGRWTGADHAQHDALTSKLRKAEAEELAEKREAIAAAKGRFVSVTFTKKDGSKRVMRVQPAALKNHVVGNAASEAARKAVQTRAERHPHLMPVWDVDKAAIRSVNLATVSRIAADGAVKEYRA